MYTLLKSSILIVLLTLSSYIFSYNLERIPLNSPLYINDDYIYIENGEVPNFFSRPYSYNQSYNSKPIKSEILEPILGFSLRFREQPCLYRTEGLHYLKHRGEDQIFLARRCSEILCN